MVQCFAYKTKLESKECCEGVRACKTKNSVRGENIKVLPRVIGVCNPKRTWVKCSMAKGNT